MEHYAGIDVSLELSSVCVVDTQGKIVKGQDRKRSRRSDCFLCVAFLTAIAVAKAKSFELRAALSLGKLYQPAVPPTHTLLSHWRLQAFRGIS